MDKITAFLLNEGYKLGKLHDSVPAERNVPKDCLVISDGKGTETEYVATSTRLFLLGREIGGGPLGENYGIVCGEDIRNQKFLYTLPGGRMDPFANEFRTEEDVEAEESIIECLCRETEAEVGIRLNPIDVILLGVRLITESNSNELKKIGGRVCVDAYFACIVDERLGTWKAKDGEVGSRLVLNPEDLLQKNFQEKRHPLPDTQRLAIATSIITLNELYGEKLPEAITSVIDRTLSLAQKVFRTNRWVNNFIPLIQQV